MKYLIVLWTLVAAVAGDVSHLSNSYLPPSHHFAASAPAASYSAAPAVSYSAPAEQSYHVEAASAPAVSYSAPAEQSYHVEAASAPAESYSAPAEQSYQVEAASYSADVGSYDAAASAPAHTFSSSDGYRYKSIRRRVIRRQRRDVSHLSSEYLPPADASAPEPQYESASAYSGAASEPAVEYAAPATSYESPSFETAASAPAHSFSSAGGYRYKTVKRRIIRRRRL